MSFKSLGDPYSFESDLVHNKDCSCDTCQNLKHHLQNTRHDSINDGLANNQTTTRNNETLNFESSEDVLNRVVENAVIRGIFGQNDLSRRQFMGLIGGSAAAAVIGSIFPMEAAKAAVQESAGKLEKTKLTVGFVPITCATPIIMAHPMGFYSKHGLDVDLIKTAGWAVARDKSLAGEYDASHMLTPMPIAISLGIGSSPQPYIMPAIENINGQAIVLHVDHKDKRDPKLWKGLRFGIPFEYSMHNFLLRYYVAEHGLDPDRDIQLRVVPPAEMVANLSAGNIDGFLGPDPFNQRAVWEKAGFIHILTKDIWPGHPCCAFACSKKFAELYPNTYMALLKSIIDATQYASKAENRTSIAEAIAPKNYLNQPIPVIQQVLTGRFADGLGEIQTIPNRIDFDPFPWQSMALWILTQMKRWGYISGDIDYKSIAEQVYLTADARKVMSELGLTPAEENYTEHRIMGKPFDSSDPKAYVESFAIRR
jgi:nitrate/nitrite transport system substrate-binding protein